MRILLQQSCCKRLPQYYLLHKATDKIRLQQQLWRIRIPWQLSCRSWVPVRVYQPQSPHAITRCYRLLLLLRKEWWHLPYKNSFQHLPAISVHPMMAETPLAMVASNMICRNRAHLTKAESEDAHQDKQKSHQNKIPIEHPSVRLLTKSNLKQWHKAWKKPNNSQHHLLLRIILRLLRRHDKIATRCPTRWKR